MSLPAPSTGDVLLRHTRRRRRRMRPLPAVLAATFANGALAASAIHHGSQLFLGTLRIRPLAQTLLLLWTVVVNLLALGSAPVRHGAVRLNTLTILFELMELGRISRMIDATPAIRAEWPLLLAPPLVAMLGAALSSIVIPRLPEPSVRARSAPVRRRASHSVTPRRP
ncbi:MAG: hypothetical protein N2652_04660 [Kiritimatiellae bacterium]|nr:hypothetical protein [Kiritimatiellia bacterium]